MDEFVSDIGWNTSSQQPDVKIQTIQKWNTSIWYSISRSLFW